MYVPVITKKCIDTSHSISIQICSQHQLLACNHGLQIFFHDLADPMWTQIDCLRKCISKKCKKLKFRLVFNISIIVVALTQKNNVKEIEAYL